MPRDYGGLRTLTTKSIQPSYLATIKGIFFGPTCLVPLSNLQDIVSLGTNHRHWLPNISEFTNMVRP